MTEIVGIRFKSGGKEYYFDPAGLEVHVGQEVIAQTAKGPEFGVCSKANAQVEDQAVVQPLRTLARMADERDRAALEKNREKERKALKVCEEKIAEHKLDMKLVDVECSFDGNKLLFFFTSEGRVDFRGLVRDLAAAFHTRIELRQIGVRDESRLLGGLGICGRPFCCASFLDQFQPVSIKMAKTQGLSLNPAKISGACGRLMCCLKYEQGAYEDAVKRLPKNESFVETPDGAGTVSSVDFLRERVKVRLEDSMEPAQSYAGTEINVIRSGKGRRPEGYIAPPKAELAKLRKETPPPPPVQPRDLSRSINSALGELDGGDQRRQGQERRRDDRSRPPRGDRPPQQGQQRQQPAKQQRPPKPQAQPAAGAKPEAPKEGSGGRPHRRRHRGKGGRGDAPKSEG